MRSQYRMSFLETMQFCSKQMTYELFQLVVLRDQPVQRHNIFLCYTWERSPSGKSNKALLCKLRRLRQGRKQLSRLGRLIALIAK